MYEPLDNTNHSWSVVEKKITSLGLKFVPTICRYDSPKKLIDFMEFRRKLRLAVFFHHLHKSSSTVEGNTTGHDNVTIHQDQNYSYEDDKNLGTKQVHLILHQEKRSTQRIYLRIRKIFV